MTRFPDSLTARLQAPLDKDDPRVRILEQRGEDIPYIPSHEVIDTLNADFGADGWTRSVLRSAILWVGPIERRTGTNQVVIAEATVELHIISTGQRMSDVGVCMGEAKAAEPPPYDTALMGAASIGLSRAAKQLGNRYGNSLRDRDDPHGYAVAAMTTPRSSAGEPVSAPPAAPPLSAAESKPAAVPADPQPVEPPADDDDYAYDPRTDEEIGPPAVERLIHWYFETHGSPPSIVVEKGLEPGDIAGLDRDQLLELWTVINEQAFEGDRK